MCMACDFACCALDCFEGCGCDCDDPACQEAEDADDFDDDFAGYGDDE